MQLGSIKTGNPLESLAHKFAILGSPPSRKSSIASLHVRPHRTLCAAAKDCRTFTLSKPFPSSFDTLRARLYQHVSSRCLKQSSSFRVSRANVSAIAKSPFWICSRTMAQQHAAGSSILCSKNMQTVAPSMHLKDRFGPAHFMDVKHGVNIYFLAIFG